MKINLFKLKKIRLAITYLIIIVLTINATAYTLEFSDGANNYSYVRTDAADYLYLYTWNPNNSYYDYTQLGGDCTNYISQMLYAGNMSMTSYQSNPTDADWYYYGSSIPYRTASWTGAPQFRRYWGVINGVGYKNARAMYKYTFSELKNNTNGAFTNIVSRCYLGDVIQFVDSSGSTYHTMGVQRVFYENGVRKVTIAQHTANQFYRLNVKIDALPSSTGWVCLLKMKNDSVYNINGLSTNDILMFATEDQINSIIDISNLDEDIPLLMLSDTVLEKLFNELQYIPTDNQTAENQKWGTINGIGKLLDSRIEESGVEEPKMPVTKALLIDFINDSIMDCRLRLIASENADISYIDEDAVITIEEGKTVAQSQLDVLTVFLEEVEQNVTEENVSSFWIRYWTDVLNLPIPQGYEY